MQFAYLDEYHVLLKRNALADTRVDYINIMRNSADFNNLILKEKTLFDQHILEKKLNGIGLYKAWSKRKKCLYF